MNIDYAALEVKHRQEDIKEAVGIAQKASQNFPESYSKDPDFWPHLWVVSAVCLALESKK